MPYDDLPRFELAFPGPLRDRLVAAVLSGAKTATTGLREEYSRLNEPLPVTGRREVMIDSAGRTVAVVEMTDVQVVPLGEIDLAYAIAEGEGHTSVAEWRADHERFWCGAEMRKAIGEVVIDDRTEVVAQRFRVAERLAPRAAEELLDIVDEEDRVIGQAPRGEAYARGLRRGSCSSSSATARAGSSCTAVRRASWSSRPCMTCSWAASSARASPTTTRRCGRPRRSWACPACPGEASLFSFLYEGRGDHAGHTWWSRVYEVRCDLPVSPQAEEVAWHAFLTEEELARHLPEWEWVPDGLEAYHRLRGLGEA